MKCFHCKKIIPDNSKFCPLCGEEQGFSEELLERAQKEDPDAISVLYIRTYDCVYTTLKILIRDEETVLDLVQDTYLKGIQNLGQLREADKFRPWIKRIARNLGVDHLRKKKVVLFSQMEEDADAPVDFEDDRTASLPEEMLDQRETARLMREILAGLNPEQRVVVEMYYYDQMSVRKIAGNLGISENTVKSRLLYGRRKIEASVKTLEKQGTKLYGLAPVPFLLFLFKNVEAQAAGTFHPGVLQAVESGIQAFAEGSAGMAAGTGAGAGTSAGAAGTGAAAGAAGKTAAGMAAGAAAKTAAGATGKSLAVKILIAAAVIGLGGAGGVMTGVLVEKNQQKEAQVAQTEGTETKKEDSGKEETKKEQPEEENFDRARKPGEVTLEPYEVCFTGTDVPMPEEFFDLPMVNALEVWDQTGEAHYGFMDPTAQKYPIHDENGEIITEPIPVDSMECVKKLNTYMLGRGYGREARFRNKDNGGMDYLWYKDDLQIRINVLADNNFGFSIVKNRPYVPVSIDWYHWSYQTQDIEGHTYISTLDFYPDGRVEYMHGLYRSEPDILASGTYTLESDGEEDRVSLNFPTNSLNGEAMNMECVYRYTLAPDRLGMEYISGVPLNMFQDVGSEVNYYPDPDA